MSRERDGVLLCLASACGFGAMAVFAKLAYGAGLDVVTLLSLRFVLAAALLWAIVALRGVPLRAVRRALAAGAVLGLAGYSLQAGLFFLALERIDAGLTALLLYTYPAFVTVGGLLLGRDRADRRRWVALGVASLGLILVLGAGGGDIDAIGAGLALGSGLAYSIYILGSDRVVRRIDPLAFAAAVCTGAAVTFVLAAAIGGGLDLGFGAEGWGWVLAIVTVSTVLPIVTFFGGLDRVGPSRASILSTVEPPVTVLLALLVFGETLGWLQVVGGALVLSGAVLVVQQLDPERGGQRRGDLDDVGPPHPGPAQGVRAA